MIGYATEFFPTPKHIINKMLTPYLSKLRESKFTVLDPSAGKGDILAYIADSIYHRDVKIYAIEIDAELRHILNGKGFKVIANDFLTYTGSYFFDLIAMNPPFSNGDEHLLKAWEVLKQGDIVCLLNAETIKNPYTKTRKLLANIIEANGSVEYLGNCFEQAERKANVEVAMVRLHKEMKGEENPFDSFAKPPQKTDFEGIDLNNQLARIGQIENLVAMYQQAIPALQDFIKAKARAMFYIEHLFNRPYEIAKLLNEVKANTLSEQKNSFNDLIDEVKSEAWDYVFAKTKIEKMMTGKLLSKFAEFKSSQGAMDFTIENIESLFDMLFLNREQIMQDALLDVFEKMTSYAPENKIHWEGWKTNNAYKVNKKVIMPYFVSWSDWQNNFDRNYEGNRNTIALNDIDKVMCFIKGEKIQNITTIAHALNKKFEWYKESKVKYSTSDNTCESTFFNLRFYKKGTLHIEFADQYLWEQFNVQAAKGKNWLPN